MTRGSIEAIIQVLNDAGVRYLIVGGLAVVAHGHTRLTVDLDLVLALDEENLTRTVRSLESLGYRPRAPVPFLDFTDAHKREAWMREKGLTVFSTHSSQHPMTEVDLFVSLPFDFERAYADATRIDLGSGAVATFVGLQDLIDMKRRAGRPRDLDDIRALEDLHGIGDASS